MITAKALTGKKAAKSLKICDVPAFMQTLDHPLKAELQALRTRIVAVDSSISEGIKWNAPGFRTTEYFATFNLRSKDAAQLILHFGAKVNVISTGGVAVDDPNGLLTWLAKDRATIKFRDMNSIIANGSALSDIVRQWIAHVH